MSDIYMLLFLVTTIVGAFGFIIFMSFWSVYHGVPYKASNMIGTFENNWHTFLFGEKLTHRDVSAVLPEKYTGRRKYNHSVAWLKKHKSK